MANSGALVTRRLTIGWLVWCAFVVYGSLVPFQYRAVEWGTAVATFVHMPWLDIGLGGRLDWLANVLLYVPVGFLGTLVLGHGTDRRPAAPRGVLKVAWGGLLSLGIGTGLALAVEFTQIFFAPRTVSLNDLAAEIVGTAIGCVLAMLAGARFIALLTRLGTASSGLALDWLKLYLLAYLALSFFPFDFSTALTVFEQKLTTGHAAWWWAPVNGSRSEVAVLKLGLEALLTIPFGLALGGPPWRLRWPTAALLGLAAGAVIEVVQLFLLSATSQGASALSRSIGFAAGALLAPRWPGVRAWATRRRLRMVVALFAGPWLLAMASLAGWGRDAVVGNGWGQRASELHYLPFYYHYYVGEAHALTSVLLVVGCYAWVGVALALVAPSAPAWLAPGVAWLLAAGFEASKLFLADQHPDPTNALVAAAAAWVVWWLMGRLRGHGVDAASPAAAPTPRAAALPEVQRQTGPRAIDAASIHGAVVAATMIATLRFAHGHVIALAVATLIYAACVWRQPLSVLFLIPAVIALTDLNAYTGLRWLDFSDLAMLATLAIAVLLPRPDAAANGAPPRMRSAALWLILLLLPGVWIGARGTEFLDPNALLTPLGSAHGLLLAKGLLFALVLVFFVRRARLDSGAVAVAFGRGMLLALAGVVALTVYERLSFVAPLDFASDYRAPGPFTEIALGGAYIECFLAAAVPFAVVAAFRERSRPLRWAAAMLVPAAAYATMVTFSRGGQVVFLAGVVTTMLLLVGRHRADLHAGDRVAAWAKGAALAGMVGLVAGAVLMAPYATTRFHQLGDDSRTRLDHWSAGLGFGRDDWVASAFGNGLGSFGRESYFQGGAKSRPGMFSLHEEAGNHWLRSHPGSLSYLDQRVDARYEQRLLLSARLRSPQGTGIQALLCEKDLVQSRQCGIANLRVAASAGWQHVEQPITLPANPQAGWPPRPIRLTLFSGGNGNVDIDDLSLKTIDGQELLRNGSFEAQASHWLYSSDRHLTWHLKNLWLQLYFELGWLGVLAHAGLLLSALAGAWRAAKNQNDYWLAFALSLLAFQGVGLIDSVIDSPRFLQLYLSLALLACSADAARESAAVRAPRPDRSTRRPRQFGTGPGHVVARRAAPPDLEAPSR